jgi:aminoglycoside phosphotransferase (APT) family kinase protein
VFWPEAEVVLSESLVRSLLEEQHPDLARRPLTLIDEGFDNESWRLGNDHLVRLPRRAVAAQLLLNEQRWLPVLASRLPLAVPVPLRVGTSSADYPWPWSIVPWLEGTAAHRAPPERPRDAARALGAFLRALHTTAANDAPVNAWRSVALIERQTTFLERLASLSHTVDIDAARRVWESALAAPAWGERPVWLHGDLHPANLLTRGGDLSAVIDFGDLCGGDPATDLAGAWMLLPEPVMTSFANAYGGIGEALEKRALGWAVLFALMHLEIGLGGRPGYEQFARSTLAKVIARSRATS